MRRRDPTAGCRGRSAPASASVRTPGRRPRPLRLRGLRVHVLRGLGPADRRDPGPAGRAGAGLGSVTVRGVEVLAAPGSASPTMPGAVGTPRSDAPDRSGRHRPRSGSDRRCSAVRGGGVVVRMVADRVACPAVVGTGCLAVVRQAAVTSRSVVSSRWRGCRIPRLLITRRRTAAAPHVARIWLVHQIKCTQRGAPERHSRGAQRRVAVKVTQNLSPPMRDGRGAARIR